MPAPEINAPATAAPPPEPQTVHPDGRSSGTPADLIRRVRRLALASAALIVCFAKPLYDLFVLASRSDLYSHAPLVPFISAYLVWIARHTLPRAFTPAPRTFASLLLAGLALVAGYWIALLNGWTPGITDRLGILVLAFLLLFWAACVRLLGGTLARAITFPLAFLVFTAPLPTILENGVVAFLQHASAEAAYRLITLSGTPVLREGTLFLLPGISIDIAPECSGVRSTLVLFITGLLAGHLFLKQPWTKTTLAISVILLGIVRNGVRIFTLAQLCIQVDPEMIHSDLHRRGGPLFFALSLIPLFLLIWSLRTIERRKKQ